MSLFSFLSYADFKARTIMPSADLDRIAYLKWEKKTADNLATDVTAECPIGQPGESVGADGNVVFATITARAFVASDGANYATAIISKRPQGGGNATVIASIDTSSAPLLPNIPTAIPISESSISQGDLLTAQITKTGTGVLLPLLSVVVAPSPNWVDVNLAGWTSRILDQLRKRYSIPMVPPYPMLVLRWLEKMSTCDCFARRGWNPTSQQDQSSIEGAQTTALSELALAADAENGLFDLPVRADLPGTSGITTATRGYAEQSPYTWVDRQANAVRGRGTRGFE